MLSYAYQVLKHSNYEEIASEPFDNIHDLFAAILAKGIAQQLKQGLYREYVLSNDELTVLRGKLDIQRTIQNSLRKKTLIVCEYDQLTENNVFNQILKTTAVILLKTQTVHESRQKALKKALLLLNDVDTVEPSNIDWSKLRFQRHNRSYKMLLNLCYFVLEGLLLTTERGTYKMATFLDGHHMARLFEKFVLEYYRHHHPLLKAAPKQIRWDTDEASVVFLPSMNTDITLRYRGKTLIIDTKYYSKTMQIHTQYESYKLHSANLYQILAYVKNEDSRRTGNVAGMLLYAKTAEKVSPDCEMLIGGNMISVKTLDLNIPFPELAAELDKIAVSYFEDYPKAGY